MSNLNSKNDPKIQNLSSIEIEIVSGGVHGCWETIAERLTTWWHSAPTTAATPLLSTNEFPNRHRFFEYLGIGAFIITALGFIINIADLSFDADSHKKTVQLLNEIANRTKHK